MGKSIKLTLEISFDTAKPQCQRNLKDYKVWKNLLKYASMPG